MNEDGRSNSRSKFNPMRPVVRRRYVNLPYEGNHPAVPGPFPDLVTKSGNVRIDVRMEAYATPGRFHFPEILSLG